MRSASTRGTVQSFGLMLAFSAFWVLATTRVIEGALLGAGLFLVYRLVIVRWWVCRHHRRGIDRTRAGRLEDALHAFVESERFWERHTWLDARRGWLLGSASRWPFAALARYNQGVCLSALGRHHEALEILDDALVRWPELSPAREMKGAILAADAAAAPGRDWESLLSEEGLGHG